MKNITKILSSIESEIPFPNIHLVQNSHINRLKDLDKTELIIGLFQNFDSRFCNGLLLSIPSLWESLTFDNWIEISSKVEPKNIEVLEENSFKNIHNDHSYGDLIFLAVYFRLDPIELLSRMGDNEIRINKLRFINLYPFKFTESAEIVEEDLLDFYNISSEQWNSYLKIIPESCRIGNSDSDNLRSRSKEQLELLG